MSLDPRLLALLVCPACKSSLDYDEAKSALSCPRCPKQYPVVDGIPDFVG